MKVIIIDGPDNTGKDTLINNICYGESNKVIHCSKPLSKIDPFTEQVETYNKLVDDVIYQYARKFCDNIIFNRFYPGEYVYGQLYRNGDRNKIADLILQLEVKLLHSINSNDLYYIQILSTSDKLLQKNDDNLSLSNAKLDLIHKEQQLFKEAFDYSIIPNKKIVYINEADTDNFRPKEDIINEVISFLEK